MKTSLDNGDMFSFGFAQKSTMSILDIDDGVESLEQSIFTDLDIDMSKIDIDDGVEALEQLLTVIPIELVQNIMLYLGKNSMKKFNQAYKIEDKRVYSYLISIRYPLYYRSTVHKYNVKYIYEYLLDIESNHITKVEITNIDTIYDYLLTDTYTGQPSYDFLRYLIVEKIVDRSAISVAVIHDDVEMFDIQIPRDKYDEVLSEFKIYVKQIVHDGSEKILHHISPHLKRSTLELFLHYINISYIKYSILESIFKYLEVPVKNILQCYLTLCETSDPKSMAFLEQKLLGGNVDGDILNEVITAHLSRGTIFRSYITTKFVWDKYSNLLINDQVIVIYRNFMMCKIFSNEDIRINIMLSHDPRIVSHFSM